MTRLVIDAEHAEHAYWADLWRYRELFFILSWRDILVRYKQTVIGVLWAVIRPLLTTVIFTILFNKMAKMPTDGMPPTVFVYAAMLPWQFFSSALTDASNSLIANANMLSKVYFPRLIVPASSVMVCLVDFLISTGILAVLMAIYHVAPNWRLVTLPLFTALAFCIALGSSLWLSALNVRFRDFRYIIPFIVQFGLYVSPVGYASSFVREKFGGTVYQLYLLNPMAGVIDSFRWAIGGQAAVVFPWQSVSISLLVAALITVTGLAYFRSTEETFADII